MIVSMAEKAEIESDEHAADGSILGSKGLLCRAFFKFRLVDDEVRGRNGGGTPGFVADSEVDVPFAGVFEHRCSVTASSSISMPQLEHLTTGRKLAFLAGISIIVLYRACIPTMPHKPPPQGFDCLRAYNSASIPLSGESRIELGSSGKAGWRQIER